MSILKNFSVLKTFRQWEMTLLFTKWQDAGFTTLIMFNLLFLIDLISEKSQLTESRVFFKSATVEEKKHSS